jgi:hypothetical protein
MTNFENIKTVKTILKSGAYKAIDAITKDSGASYYYVRALIDTGIVGKVNGRYTWLKEEEINIRTFNKLKSIVLKGLLEREVTSSNTEPAVSHQVTAGNGITINFSNGKAIVRRNGRSIECDDLQSVESLIKFIS